MMWTCNRYQISDMAEQRDTMTPVVLAVDIGATKIAVGLVHADGAIAFQSRERSPVRAEPSLALIERLGRAAEVHARKNGLTIEGTGIACGGPLDLEKGLVLSPPNLPDWDRIPLTTQMETSFGAKAYLQNDAAAGAIATALWDNPDAVRDVTYITVSSGIGCGVITDGFLYTGHTGNGSELGHIPLIYDGRACNCGLKGCFEAYASGTAIGKRYTEAKATCMATPRSYSARDVADAALAGDEEALAFWHSSMGMLARAVRAAADLFDPALLVIGGGVTEADGELFAPAMALVGSSMAASVGQRLTVRKTGFGRNSGVASAASVAWNEIGSATGFKVRIRE